MLCGCGCGQETKLVKITDVRRGIVKGEPRRFLQGHNRRGVFHEIEYYAFYAARRRCTNPDDGSYHNYGARGIEFRFTDFKEFFEHLGLRPNEGYTLDRIDNNRHYEIGNVRWATWSENLRNRRKCKRKRGYKLSPEHVKRAAEGHRGLTYNRH